MKEPTRAPIFACLYPGLCDKARALGYALAIHGTVTNDLDLIAVPWADHAVSAIELRDALMEHIAAVSYEDLLRRDSPHLTEQQISSLIVGQEGTNPGGQATEKPHGRLAWNLYLYYGSKVDLSVMPRGQMLPVEDYLAWVKQSFPGESLADQITHLKEEFVELAEDFSRAEEYADVLMLMMCVAAGHEIDLLKAFYAKFEINKKRTWEKTDRGFRHVSNAEAEQRP